jgi:hypothetical protein
MRELDGGVPRWCANPTRREFLRAGGFGALGAALANHRFAAASDASGDRSVILLLMVGGPSQLETFDPKPQATSEIRGPFRAIETRVPGVRISEFLPNLARRLDRVAIVRSLHHGAAPIHETGQQLIQTGRLSKPGVDAPHVGSTAAKLLGCRSELPPFVTLPAPISNTGVGISHGQTAGVLGDAFDPVSIRADPASADYDPRAVADRARRSLDHSVDRPSPSSSIVDRFVGSRVPSAFDLGAEPTVIREAYGRGTFGQSCLMARRLVEAGVRVVAVNMFETVFHKVTWDCHGVAPFSTLADYAEVLLPTFDRAFGSLLDDLEQRGRLDSTLVVATGEFGRTPRLNAAGGRDHWPGVWSALVAGGGVRGGQVIGASDALGAEPADRPVTPAELVATMYLGLGINPARRVETADGESMTLVDDASPIDELFS